MRRGRLSGLVLASVLLASCSSGGHVEASSEGSKAAFCRVARSVRAENSKPVDLADRAGQKKVLTIQLAKLGAAATTAEGEGWADATVPLPMSASGALDSVLRRDCSLTVDIFGRTSDKSSTPKSGS